MATDPKKVPLGPPLELTDEQLEEEARITDTDIQQAKAFWRAHAPEKFETLLDAQPVEEEADQ